MAEKHYSGHLYRGSATECDDSCGTCDGARCDSCRKYWTVYGIDDTFTSAEEAEVAEKSYLDSIEALLPEFPDFHNEPCTPRFTIVNGLLCVQVWKKPSFKGDPNYGYKYLPCNSGSSKYDELFKEAQDRINRYTECKCTDKDTADEGCNAHCTMMGCIDGSCYYEMKNKNRTEKKWYM